MRDPKRAMAAATLVMEALVVLFAGLVAGRLTGLGVGPALAVFGGIALLCVLASGLLRSPAGYALGTALQVAVLASGFLVPAMWFLGLVFGGLWLLALSVGRRIEQDRATIARERARREGGTGA